MTHRVIRVWPILLCCVFVLSFSSTVHAATKKAPTYTNPLPIVYPKHGKVENCPDPSVIRGQSPDTLWYAFCGQTQLNSKDKTGKVPNSHRLPILTSPDLVHWTYAGDALSATPSWFGTQARMTAPDAVFVNGQYVLYYSVSDTADVLSGETGCTDDSAIGVLTAAKPTGPWTDHGSPVIAPRRGGPGCAFYHQFFPNVVTDAGQNYIFFGDWTSGLQLTTLSADGLSTPDPTVTPPTQIALPNRYEAAEVVKHGAYWYLLASASSGYNIFAGRAATLTGPFVDSTGASFLDAQIGGTPVLAPNGNRWLLPRHATVVTDLAGQDWLLYNAVDSKDKGYGGATNYLPCTVVTCRLLLDRLDWVKDGNGNEWPTVRMGTGASDKAQPAPIVQSGQIASSPTETAPTVKLGALLPQSSDEFNAATLGTQWSWVRQPQISQYTVADGAFQLQSQAAELYGGSNTASVLTEALPKGNLVIETKLAFAPGDGDPNTYFQAGLVLYGNDDNYLKFVHESLYQTRQMEFGKEAAKGFYGSLFGTAPGATTYLRVVKQIVRGKEVYTAYSSTDGLTYGSAGTWTTKFGSKARIGLVAMSGAGYTAAFDYVHVYQLAK